MRKSLVVTLAIILLAGIGTINNAGAYLTFGVDFWSTGNAVNNYAKGGPGDLGSIIVLNPGETINVDIYFSTDQSYIAGSWDLKFSPFNLVDILGTTAAGSPWALPNFVETPGSLKYEDLIFPPGSTITGNNLFFGSVLFQCLGEGDVNLVLSNYLGFLKAVGGDNFTDVNLGTLQQQPVPIPGAVWLLGTGLIGLVGLRRKFRK